MDRKWNYHCLYQKTISQIKSQISTMQSAPRNCPCRKHIIKPFAINTNEVARMICYEAMQGASNSLPSWRINSRVSNDELAIRTSKSLWSKGDIRWAHEPLETLCHWLGEHIPTPRDRFLQEKQFSLHGKKSHNPLIYYH